MSSKIPTVSDVRQKIARQDEKYRLALMYQFLIGGTVSEICGKYAPKGSDAHEVEFDIKNVKIPSVLFLVKTARRPDHLRPCAIPIDKRYEPWAEQVLDQFKRVGENLPFRFSERSFQNAAKAAFGEYECQKDDYTDSETGKRIERRYSPFTSSSIRELRRKNLKNFYGFNEKDLAIFGAWYVPIYDVQLKSEIENIFSSMRANNDFLTFKEFASTYFEKFLWPIQELEKPYDVLSEARSYLISKSRDERGIQIITKIIQTNILFEGKIGPKLFLENNIRIITDLITPCNSENDLYIKNARLSSLFDVNLDPFKKLVKSPNNKKSISLVEDWLAENSIKYEPSMIETWRNIVKLRNMDPMHPYVNSKELLNILDFFDLKKKIPYNSALLWDSILDKFFN